MSFDDDWIAALAAAAPDVRVRQITAGRVEDIPAEVWAGVEVLHTSTVFPTPDQAPNLKWVQLDTAGVDHVRPLPIWSTDIPLVTIGGISPVPLAEYVMFAILGVAHRLPQMLAVQKDRAWPDPAQRWDRFLPARVAGSTVGIVGYGRIGREIGRLARAHGMSVLGLTRTGRLRSTGQRQEQADFGRSGTGPDADPTEILGPDRLPELVARADYLVVVVPLTASTNGMIDAGVLGAARPGAVLINVARGGIVDETALRSGLRDGRISAAVLDVFDDEPLPPDSPWWTEPNVFVTPHVSGLAPSYAAQVRELVTENLRRFRDGSPLINTVDRGPRILKARSIMVNSLERQRRLLAHLRIYGSGNVVELADALGVSPSTVRRDLNEMDDRGLLTRVHGGASSLEGLVEPVLSSRSTTRLAEKRRIGQAAAVLIPDGATILLTGGTTTEAMLPFLAGRKLTILTNGLNIAYHLTRYPEISVVVLGGVLRHDEMSLLGPIAERALAEFHLDAVFSSVFGIDPETGLSGANVSEADTDRRMLEAAPLTVLADSSKIGRRGPVRLMGVLRAGPAGDRRRRSGGSA